MNLSELAREYRATGLLCREKAAQLRRELEAEDMAEMERLRARCRLCMVESMARDAIATGNYLANYYGRKDAYAQGGSMGEGTELSGAAELLSSGGHG
jgi:hypothetical protein